MKHMKLKATVIAVALSAALVGGATLAWFTDQKEIAQATFQAGTVEIDADLASFTYSADETKNSEMPYTVVDFAQGLNNKQKAIKADRRVAQGDFDTVYNKISQRTLHQAQPDIADFFTLGFGGHVAIQLNRPLPAGDNLWVIECTYNNDRKHNEAVLVEVSSTGLPGSWVPVGTFNKNDDREPGASNSHQHTLWIEIDTAAMEFDGPIHYIQLTDMTGELDGTSSEDGFDIDYLGIPLSTDNWNPGDSNRLTYFVKNVGTKAIQLRAKVEGEWDNPDLPGNPNVKFELDPVSEGLWELGNDGNFYYIGTGNKLDGSYNTTPQHAYLYVIAKLDGASTGNEYQGETFHLQTTFQAIQNSHQAAEGEPGWTWGNFEDYN